MSCVHFEEAIATSVDFELSRGQQIELDRHLGSCASCRRLLEDLREDRGILAEPVSWKEVDLDAIRRPVLEEVAVQSAGRSFRWLAWAAALLLAVGLGWMSRSDSEKNRGLPMQIAEHAPWSELVWSEGEDSIVPREYELLPSPVLTVEPAARSATASDPAPEAPLESQESSEPTEVRESMVIQMVSTDPDLVIYWLVDPTEDNDETSTS